MKQIKDLGPCELLCQLAEEAAELSKAALKMRRAIDGKNPTPKSREACETNLIEEIADVVLIEAYLIETKVLPENLAEVVEEISKFKQRRWENRLNGNREEKQS